MRIRANDPRAAEAIVRRQGVPVLHCVAVDTGEGWADVVKTDARGRPIIERGQIAIERIYGEFTVEFAGEPQTAPQREPARP